MIKTWKEFNENNPIEGSLFDLFGEIVEKRGEISRTSKNVYANEWWLKEDIHIKVVNEKWQNGDINVVYSKMSFGGNSSWHHMGYLLMKENRPFIFSGIKGDDKGAVLFNNTFIVTGHDGNYLFNVNDPFDAKL